MKKNFMKKIFFVLGIILFYVLINITTSFGASKASMSVKFRKDYKINQVDADNITYIYHADRIIKKEKYVPQGFCIAKGYFVYVMYNNNSKSKNHNQTYLSFVRIKNPKLVNRISLGNIGHINDITYNPSTQKIIVPIDDNSKYVLVDVSSSDPKNFKKIKNTINKAIKAYGIAYCNEHKNYIISHVYNIYYTQRNNITKVAKKKDIVKNNGNMNQLGRQGIACHGNRWYYTKWVENNTYYADKNSNIIEEYDFDYNVKQNIYIPKSVFSGEIEGVDFYDNQMYGLFIQGDNLRILKIDYSTGFKIKTKNKEKQKYYYYKNTEANHFKGQKAKKWNIIDGKTYYMEKDSGKVVTGWYTINGFKYYFGKDGVMRTGLQTIGGKKYYFYKSNGKNNVYRGALAAKGWNIIDENTTYYVKKGGVVATGWNTIDGFKYYFGDNGVMRTGLQTIGGKKYYFYKSTNKIKKQYRGALAYKV